MEKPLSILLVHQNWVESFSICKILKKKGYHLFACYDDMYEAITSIHREEKPPDLAIFNLERNYLKRSFTQARTFEFLFERPVLLTTGLRQADISPFVQDYRKTQILHKPFTFSQLEKSIQKSIQLHNQSFAKKLMSFT